MTSILQSENTARRTAHLSVPSEDGAILAAPSLTDAAQAAIQTQQRLNASQLDVQGRSLMELRRWSRDECLKAAASYTKSIDGGDAEIPAASGPLVIAGHQPALFHPGVWIKNFAIGKLAESMDGIGLNLVVDNDTLNQTGVRIPGGSLDAPRYETELFDTPRQPQPWEDIDCRDRSLFASFGGRISERMKRWGIEPVVNEIWPDAIQSLNRSPKLVDALTTARHRQEVRWGTSNLELPVSRMCQTDPFLWFASHVLAQLPRFHEVHNRVLAEYRVANRIRSRSHPVPALSDADGWLEAPFWLWRSGEHHRRPVFARQSGRELQLSDSREVVATLKLSPEMEACCSVEELRRLAAVGLRFRTRALTTTLFARVALGDLFVHGIGGAKYDELTDCIINEFFDLATPPFQTLSATLRLPLHAERPPAELATGDIRQELRDLKYNADRHEPGGDVQSLIERKRTLVAAQHEAQTSGLSYADRRARSADNRRRYLQLKQVNAQLLTRTESRRRTLELKLARAERDTAVSRLLLDRDYAYCLHPADRLLQLMQSLNCATDAHYS